MKIGGGVKFFFYLDAVTLTLECLSRSIFSLYLCQPFENGHNDLLLHTVVQHRIFKHSRPLTLVLWC